MNFASLRILTDENVSTKIVKFLRSKSFDVLDTKEQNWFGKTDSFILNQSNTESRFVLTFDSDFGTSQSKTFLWNHLFEVGAPNQLKCH